MALSNSLVSIIIPVYNVSAYIDRCIKSVMNQTYTDIECIIVDDATPDDSIVKCEQMIAAYEGQIQFTILHHQKNRGLSAARNTGTAAATGEFIYYLDSDDEITPNCIETLMKPMLDDNSIEMVQGNHITIFKSRECRYNNVVKSISVSGGKSVNQQFFKYHHLCATAWNKLIRRSFINTFQLYFKEGLLYEDRLWMFFVLKHLKKTFISKDVTYFYSIRDGSITRGSNGEILGKSFCVIYSIILDNLTIGSEKSELRGYCYDFCEPYCLYVDQVPMLKDILVLYQKMAKLHGCWCLFFLLYFIGVCQRFYNPIKILNKLRIAYMRLVSLRNFSFRYETRNESIHHHNLL